MPSSHDTQAEARLAPDPELYLPCPHFSQVSADVTADAVE